jgi:hypothetical protein
VNFFSIIIQNGRHQSGLRLMVFLVFASGWGGVKGVGWHDPVVRESGLGESIFTDKNDKIFLFQLAIL